MFQEIPVKISSKSIKRPMYGLGINDVNYKVRTIVSGKSSMCPYYRRWADMLKRCYSSNYQEKQPTYIDCSVCKEWLTFSNFKSWMITQDWKDKQLDKDILIQGNKIYSPERCLFVAREINLLLGDRKAMRGEFPVGVCWDKRERKFKSYVSNKGRLDNLGYFDTAELAHSVYLKAKYSIIKQVANKQPEPLRSALLAFRVSS